MDYTYKPFIREFFSRGWGMGRIGTFTSSLWLPLCAPLTSFFFFLPSYKLNPPPLFFFSSICSFSHHSLLEVQPFFSFPMTISSLFPIHKTASCLKCMNIKINWISSFIMYSFCPASHILVTIHCLVHVCPSNFSLPIPFFSVHMYMGCARKYSYYT